MEAIKVLPNLRMLRLSGLGLKALAPHTFSRSDLKNSSLKFLDISSNNINTLSADAFNGLNYLTNLSLFENKFQEIDANAFSGEYSTVLLMDPGGVEVSHNN